jgi:hypothetical protein
MFYPSIPLGWQLGRQIVHMRIGRHDALADWVIAEGASCVQNSKTKD